jgi:hypothetical protein
MPDKPLAICLPDELSTCTSARQQQGITFDDSTSTLRQINVLIPGSGDYTVALMSYAALTAALSVNSWNEVTLPLRNVNTMAKSESNPLPADVVAV